MFDIDTAIYLKRLTKTFRRFSHSGWRALHAFGFPVSEKRYETFYALHKVGFTAKKGEKIALIGRNGAGKSTLLRLISGQMQADSGDIRVQGKVQTLMELGTGFHPDFTGIENLRSSFAYQGIPKHKMASLIDEIIEFSELKDFIHRPVREYSSGMYARLAFAAATTVVPEILIIDEILGAGDSYFAGKCLQRMKQITSQGTTILFVSHDMSAVHLLCDRGIWIDKGEIKEDGDILSVSKAYLASLRGDEENRLREHSVTLSATNTISRLAANDRYGSGPLKITDFEFFNETNTRCHTLISGELATCIIGYATGIPICDPVAAVTLYRPDGTCAMQITSNRHGHKLGMLESEGKIKIDFAPLWLGPGDYIVSIALFKDLNIASGHEPSAFDLHDRCYALKVLPPPGIGVEIGMVNQTAQWTLLPKTTDKRFYHSDLVCDPELKVYEPSHILMLTHDQLLDRRVVAQAQSLILQGHQITLLALSHTADGSSEITPEGIKLIRIGLKDIVPNNRIYKSYISGRNTFANILHVVDNPVLKFFSKLLSKMNWLVHRVLLTVRYQNLYLHDPLPFKSAFLKEELAFIPDLVQVHDLPTLEAGVALAESWGVPLIYDAHELYPEQRAFSKVQQKLCARAEIKLIQQAQQVFTVNESIAVEMAKRYNIKKPLILLNAIDPPFPFDLSKRYNLLREKLKISAERRILLFQGGFAPHRNLEDLIRAMAILKTHDIDLVMMGSGKLGKLLHKQSEHLGLLEKRIYFLPAVPLSELLQHSASADIGIIPYPHVDLNSYYCTPNKLFEFIQAGLPILANDSPELKRFVVGEEFGLVRPMHSVQQIADAIDQVFASNDINIWKQRLSERRHAYSWEVQSKHYLVAMQPYLKHKVNAR